MRTDGRSVVSPRLVVGLLIMLLGTLFLLDNMNIVDFDRLIRFWPLAPIAIGLTMLLQPSGAANKGFGGLLIVAGVWILLYDFDVIDVDFWDAWPVVLIGLGGLMVSKAFAQPKVTISAPGAAQGPMGAGPAADPAADRTRPDGPAIEPQVVDTDVVSAFAFVNGIERASYSKDFQGADLTAIMGSCKIDLRQADIVEVAVIDAFAFWGGIEILVPDDWAVINKVWPILGGAEDATLPKADGRKQLLVRGSAIMGGIKIANQPT